MVYLATSQEWQIQTSKLLQARPATTRITTKYNIPNLESEQYEKKLSNKRKRDAGEEKDAGGEVATKVALATLELKTYDPESGVTLKFKTNRAADVGRLITGLGRVGRHMAALPVKDDAQDVAMEDAAAAVEHVADAPTTEIKDATSAAESKPQQGGGGGGNKKKKKNKK